MHAHSFLHTGASALGVFFLAGAAAGAADAAAAPAAPAMAVAAISEAGADGEAALGKTKSIKLPVCTGRVALGDATSAEGLRAITCEPVAGLPVPLLWWLVVLPVFRSVALFPTASALLVGATVAAAVDESLLPALFLLAMALGVDAADGRLVLLLLLSLVTWLLVWALLLGLVLVAVLEAVLAGRRAVGTASPAEADGVPSRARSCSRDAGALKTDGDVATMSGTDGSNEGGLGDTRESPPPPTSPGKGLAEGPVRKRRTWPT